MTEAFRRIFQSKLLVFIILFSCVFTLYSASLGHNFLFDEQNLIVDNTYIRDLSNIPSHFLRGWFQSKDGEATWHQYYRPLAAVSITLDYYFWKLDPFGYNLTNVVLHALVCFLLYLLSLRILKNDKAAFLVALIYSVHPMHTQAVTYTASRPDMMAASFILAGLLCYADSRRLLCLLCYALAFFSKENSIFFPLYILCLEIYLRKTSIIKALPSVWGYFAAGVLFVLFRKYLCPVPPPPVSDLRETALRVLSMAKPLWDYFQALVWPQTFKHSQDIDFAKSFFELKILAGAAVYVGFIFLTLRLMRSKGMAFIAWALFALPLLPYLQIVHFSAEWSEHYLYVPMAGLFIFIASGLIVFVNKKRKIATVLIVIFYCFFLALFSLRTWQRNQFFNDTNLYYETLAYSESPYAYIGCQKMSELNLKKGDIAKARHYAKMANALWPSNDFNYNLLSLCSFEEGLYKQAADYAWTAYRMCPESTSYISNLAQILLAKKDLGGAYYFYNRLLKSDVTKPEGYIGLSSTYELYGDLRSARHAALNGFIHVQDRVFRARLWMHLVCMSYRHDRMGQMKYYLNKIKNEYPDVAWYGDLAYVISHKKAPEELLKYSSREEMPTLSPVYRFFLMHHSLYGSRQEIGELLNMRSRNFKRQAILNPLFAMELNKAKKKLK